jgi:YgiT-type zinc finger domain-containing protein
MAEPVDSSFPCTECQAGQLRRRYVTYFTWLADELITVPDFPSWVCDVCGRREYDIHALNQLSLLLNPTAGKPRPRTTKPITEEKKNPRVRRAD